MSEERPNPLPGDSAEPPPDAATPRIPPLAGRGPRPGSALRRPQPTEAAFTPEQRLLILDAWRRSGLPAGDFGPLVGLSKHTLYAWKRKFETEGPAGLLNKPRGGPTGSRLPEVTKRAILMLKEAHPEYGCQRISDLLLRGPALPASPQAVAHVLHEAGHEPRRRPPGPTPTSRAALSGRAPARLQSRIGTRD